MSLADEEHEQLEQLLEIHRKNLRILEQQAALYGPMNVPLHIQHGLEHEREQIPQIESRLNSYLTPPPVDGPPANNLPVLPSALIGREQELASAQTILRQASTRLLTLVGPGGTGKTRLSLQIAADLLNDFRDGVFFVNLAPVSDPTLVPATIAQTIGVRESGDQTMVRGLKEFLHERLILLVLDNFEQVIDAAPFVADLLASAPRLKLLVTSRELLRIQAEESLRVPPLPFPDLASLPVAESDLILAVIESPSAALFVERARACKRDFALTKENARTVAEICARLEGLPLAIELAAARIKLLNPAQLLARLDSRLKLLTGGMRDLPTRQQTLRAAIDWSYNLLDPAEQLLFARLSIFVGGCTLASAEAVCQEVVLEAAAAAPAPETIDVLGGLESLVDKSLLRQLDPVEEEGGEPRFVMLETIREYALERLAAGGEEGALRRQHAAHFLALVEEAEPELTGPHQGEWLDRLEAEHGNLRAALSWSLERGEIGMALRLGGALASFWFGRGYLTEGRRWLEQILTQTSSVGIGPVDKVAHAKALNCAGVLAHTQCDYVRARACYEECIALWQELGKQGNIAPLLNNLGGIAYEQGDYIQAHNHFEEALAMWHAINDKGKIAATLTNLGAVAYDQGDFAHARELYEQGLMFFRELGDKSSIASTLNNLGLTALYQSDQMQAQRFLKESLALCQELRDKQSIAYTLTNMGLAALSQADYARAAAVYTRSLHLLQELEDVLTIAECLEGMAGVAAANSEPAQAPRLWGAAEALRTSVNAPLSPIQRASLEHMMANARAHVEEAAWLAAWTAGRGLSIEQAIAEALAVGQQVEGESAIG